MATRERVGLLLDRATRAIAVRLADGRTRVARADRLPALIARRSADARAGLDAAAAALAVLGPQATLERGYAIVSRSADGAIVRSPVDAVPGTPLVLRVAHGELPATADPRPDDRDG